MFQAGKEDSSCTVEKGIHYRIWNASAFIHKPGKINQYTASLWAINLKVFCPDDPALLELASVLLHCGSSLFLYFHETYDIWSQFNWLMGHLSCRQQGRSEEEAASE